jgi:hypothetical protein
MCTSNHPNIRNKPTNSTDKHNRNTDWKSPTTNTNARIPHQQTQYMISPSPDQMTKTPTVLTTPLQNPQHNQNTVNLTKFPLLQGVLQQDDTTMGTTASNYSRTIHTNNQYHYNTRFQEIDDQIKQHQQEFNAIHKRFDSITTNFYET